MASFEYKVVPAPKKGVKVRGAKTSEDRFAHVLQTVMNDLGAQGWEYQRTDTLPSEERQGFRGKTTVFQNMLVFRRALTEAATAPVAATAPLVAEAIAPPTSPVLLESRPLSADPARREPRVAAE